MKIGRNEPCPCGSGKKYKKCCLLKEQNTITENNLELQNQHDDDEDDELNLAELFLNAGVNLHRMMLNKKPHIKEYKRIRKLHHEIFNSMISYYDSGKFEPKIYRDFKYEYKSKAEIKASKEVILLESDFDMESREGPHAFYDRLIYKVSPNMNCITEEFIKKNRYRKPEKIEFLQSMLNSKLGLFEITEIDSNEGYVYIKEVFTGDEYKITDTGMSYSHSKNKNDSCYIYTRILTHNGISFNTGLSLMFEKTDPFIKDFIKRHTKDYKPLGELIRFTELYNRFSKDSKRVKILAKSF